MRLQRNEFLIVTKMAAEQFNQIINRPDLDEKKQRKILLALVNDGEESYQSEEKKGLVKVLRSLLRQSGIEVELHLQWGVNRDGTPKYLSGKEGTRCVFCVHVSMVVPGSV